MNLPSPLPGRTFSSTRATSLKEFEFSTIGNWNKGNRNFTNVVRASHLPLKWLFIFISISRRPLLQNSKQFLPWNETSRANYLSSMRPCNILYFRPETTHICKYLKVHRLSWAIYTSTFNRPSTNRPFWSTVYSDYSPLSVSLSMQAKKLLLVTEIHQDIWWQIPTAISTQLTKRIN